VGLRWRSEMEMHELVNTRGWGKHDAKVSGVSLHSHRLPRVGFLRPVCDLKLKRLLLLSLSIAVVAKRQEVSSW